MKHANFNLKGSGEIFVVSFLALIIVGSSFLVGDVLPDLNQVTDSLDSFTPQEKKADKKNTGVVQLRQLEAKKNPRSNNNNNGNGGNNSNGKNNQNNNNQNGNNNNPNPPQQACQNNGAIAFLLDVSESMEDAGKMSKLKNALRVFGNDLPASTLVGMYTFSNVNKTEIPFGPFNKSEFDQAINRLTPRGATYTRNAFVNVRDRINETRIGNAGKVFSIVFVSDGVPELTECLERNMPGGVCEKGDDARNYDYTQDPTSNPNLATEIKGDGVRIYSIALYNQRDEDLTDGKLTSIMQNIASPGDYVGMQDTDNRLNSIFQEIARNVCK